MTEQNGSPADEEAGAGRPDVTTVEQLVRRRLAEAFGGVRGVVESAIPTIVFTVSFLVSDELRQSLIVSAAVAVLLLVVRVVQRSNPQFVFNALVGIAIAAVFASRSGEARDVFLPGILYNGAYAVIFVFTILIGWPAVGFLVGAVVGDVTGWRSDRGMRKLCTQMTWLFVAPCVLRVVVQYPLYLADEIALLGTAKIAMGWPLQVASLLAMGWMLSRNKTPLDDPSA
ncbi:DUF3159 domain-containing protein [Aeromicrobium sp. YIM 150415]|uniref:DUF3159 domain-containing protein n=1 Tax=Aeromicrobium sp. YIM 150415 TaxID=2803912 RepID=UPI00196295B8|nr:DUF3159 domain-containing protein [Aeromicrobium sp. YIM 150415]MBM9462645.1 DUF3159 domain-containing protein [Aeromicrobium sp. YIM 150415]